MTGRFMCSEGSLQALFIFPHPWNHVNKQGFTVQAEFGSVLETKVSKPNINLLTASPLHPLVDPLTVTEINAVRANLSSYAPFSWAYPAIHSLSRDEPEKLQVLEWKISDPLRRRKAQVVALLSDQTHVLVIDLGLGMVTSHVSNPASSCPLLATVDISVALQVVQSNEEFRKSIMAGGVESSDLSRSAPSAGWFGPNEEGRNVGKVQCFSTPVTVITTTFNVIGVVHNHFVTFHLDMDMDGTDNLFIMVNLVKEETYPGQSPKMSYLKAKRRVAKSEDEARIKLC
ncbi:hypothetical protein Vadar_002695 [Vaccinium darrowii]|uniref:Uncharacterized protein n=1 Tax=Vaccinium darrowii TaxID=229202 RepID=A0ACB7Y4P3_9ERIC|nr:hypothetical protein Vadar_002695 [Vaccinium darrowii]